MNSPDQAPSNALRRFLRLVVVLLLVLLFIVSTAAGVWWFAGQKARRARVLWKGPALERLAAATVTNEDLHQEWEQLKTDQGSHRWTGDHLLLMTNGEYVVFAFRHGANSGFVDHLFLGHGSDGRWYYSTYHFCNSMAAVRGEDPPGSIAEFARRYSAREFDGRSDECLRHTWPTSTRSR